MNFERLLDLLSDMGDEPDQIRQFRKIAVALAISGKLDTSGTMMRPSEIIQTVNRTKAELVKQKSIPKPKRMSAVTVEELPEAFGNPEMFAPLGEIARLEKGLTGIQQAVSGAYPLVVTAEERSTCDHFDFEGAAAIIPLVSSTGHGNASINRLHYQEGKFALGTILVAAFPYDPNMISARFLFEYLSAFKEELLVSRMTGTANVTLSVGRVAEVPVPLISPEAQRTVDELMALCDQLEAARAEREAVRNRLTAATMARLTALEADGEAFADHARFALETLPSITTRPDQIKALRQTILNLAVRGKLVAQNPTDEPVAELLAKDISLPAGYKRRRKILKASSVDASQGLLAPVPTTWRYLTIQELFDQNLIVDYADGNHGSLYPRSSEFGSEGVNFVSAKDLSGGLVKWQTCSKLNAARASQLSKGWARTGDVLLTHNATVGRVARVVEDVEPFLLGTSVTFYRLNPTALNSGYFYYVLRSSVWQGQLEAIMEQSTRNQVSIQKQASFFVPLPPLAEQHRIVAEVDALMAICDKLEASLTAASASCTRLLEALLNETLAQNSEQDIAA